jgi:hypothetical protein
MNSPESRREFANELIRRGLPVEYSHRAAEELADHHRDLIEELQALGMNETDAVGAATERLGETKSLVKKTVRAYQRRYWCGRWPTVTFLLAPIPLVFLAWMMKWLLCFIVIAPLQSWGIIDHQPDGIMSFGEWALVRGVQIVFLFLTPAAVLYFLFRLARRAALNNKWVCMSAVLLSLYAGLFFYDFNSKGFVIRVPRDQVVCVVGLPFLSRDGMWKWYTQNPWLMAQALCPLALVAILLWRSKQLALLSPPLVFED